MIKIPVFDSSQIELPTTKVKVHNYESHPITAWGRQGSRGTNRSNLTTNERPTSRTSTRGGPTPDLEVKRASPKLTRASPVSLRKWPDVKYDDRRSKSIVEMLESRRATKQFDNSSQITDNVDGAVLQYGSPRVKEDITNDNVITYPKFVVVHDKKEQTEKLDGKMLRDQTQETYQNEYQAKTAQRRENSYNSRGIDKSQLKRNVDARRSFKSYKSSKAFMYDHSNFSVSGRKSGSTRDISRSLENLKQQTPDDDLIMGFYPDEMQDYLQARAIVTPIQRAVSKHSRGPSPGYQHQPPPPTPASALLLSFGIDPEDREFLEEELRKEISMEKEVRKSKRDRMRHRDQNAANMKLDGSDPGVSHTSHRLLEAKVVKHTFAFPDITVEMQRKATGKTPRTDDLMIYSQTSSRPKTIGGIAPSNRASIEKLPTLDDFMERNGSKEDVSKSAHASHKSGREHTKAGQSKTALGSELTRSHTFIQNKDKYSKLVSLGLPKVTIDIERNHFSRDNVLRRSLLLREKFEIKDLRKEHVDGLRQSFDSNISSSHAYGESEPKCLMSISVDTKESAKNGQKIKLENKQEIQKPQSPRQQFMDTNKVLDSVEKAQTTANPPPNIPIVSEEKRKRSATPNNENESTRPKSERVLKAKVIVGVSHFKMLPPGKNKHNKTKNSESK